MDELDCINRQNIKYYDTEASVYDTKRYNNVSGRRIDIFQKNILEEYLGELPKEANILELGCGTGRFLPFLSKKGFQIIGIDISMGMLKEAYKRIKTETVPPINLVNNNPETIPFEDNVFDAVYSILVINLIKDFRNTFHDVARVIKPGGLFVFSVPNLSSIFFPIGLYVNIRGRTTTSNISGYRYSHWFTQTEINKSLKDAGFEIEVVKGQPFNVALKDGIHPLLGRTSRWLFAKSVYIKARITNK